MLGRSLRSRQGPGRSRLRQGTMGDPQAARTQLLGHLQPPGRAGGVRPHRQPAQSHPARRRMGDGDPEGVRQRAAKKMMDTGRAAAKFGVKQVNGFTGSATWHMLYSFPPNDWAEVE